MSAVQADASGTLVRTTIDGAAHDLELRGDESAIDVLRGRLGISAPKLVCGTGVCGACTVLMNGVPVNACVLPATALDRREVRTAAAADRLHPVHRAFAQHDAMQCGFCTPGFVTEAIAFHDRWRAERTGQRPDREEVAAALSGHLCRCGAYPHLFDAVAAACAGEHDRDDEDLPPRCEALDKATGAARYTVDVALPGQLEGRVIRSSRAHARITRLELDAAAVTPGVHAVHAFVAVDEIVRYVGQPVAAIAAEPGAHVQVEIAYDDLDAAIDVVAACRDDAPAIWPDPRRQRPPTSAEWPIPPAPWRRNVRGPMPLLSHRPRRARTEVQRAASEELVRGRFTTAPQMHSALEPHACVARWEDGRLELRLSTQGVAMVAKQAAGHFGLPLDHVRVLAEHVGGGFGAKGDLQVEAIAAAELSLIAERPVRVVYDRAEELTVGGMRPGTEVELALAGDARRLRGLTVTARGHGGVSVGSTVAGLMRLIYPGAKRLVDYDIVTNGAPAKPFRAPGGPPAAWALEQAIDQLAHQLGRDPIDLRTAWDSHAGRGRLYAWARQLPIWRDRAVAGATSGRFRHGVGVAAGTWVYMVDPATEVEVQIRAGRLVVLCATQDIGTGTRSLLRDVVAAELGLPRDTVDVLIGDSTGPHGPISAASRVTASVVPAARAAAAQLRRALNVDAVRPVDPAKLAAANGATAKAGRPRDGRRYVSPVTIVELRPGRGFSGAIHVVSVEVDTELGRVRPTGVWAGLSVGTVNAPVLARNQVHGGVVQGLGYALYEERDIDPRSGAVRNASLEAYKLCGIADVPPVEVHWDTEGFEHAIGGVGLGEISTLPVAAAVGNAIFNATGWRPHDLPIRPDRVLAGWGADQGGLP